MKWLPNVNADDRFYGSDGDDVGGGSCEDVDGSCEDENSQKGDDDDEEIEYDEEWLLTQSCYCTAALR